MNDQETIDAVQTLSVEAGEAQAALNSAQAAFDKATIKHENISRDITKLNSEMEAGGAQGWMGMGAKTPEKVQKKIDTKTELLAVQSDAILAAEADINTHQATLDALKPEMAAADVAMETARAASDNISIRPLIDMFGAQVLLRGQDYQVSKQFGLTLIRRHQAVLSDEYDEKSHG